MSPQLAADQNNNFNLVRVLAAFAVLYSHSYALTDGKGLTEPFRAALGMSLGGLAVDIFFVISGFLVCGSLLRRQSALDFIRGRLYRIYPALIIMVALTVLLVGPLLTSLPLADYLGHKDTFKYFYKNATLIGGVTYKLPGVFEANPYPLAVNGSLWTLPEELRMYASLLGLWLALALLGMRREKAMCVAVLLVSVGALVWRCTELVLGGAEGGGARLLGMFFVGAAFKVFWRPSLLDWRLFGLCSVVLLGSAVEPRAFALAVTVVLPYWVLFIAQVPSGPLRLYNHCGDYSYGLYLYAFPIQQAIAACMPGIGLWSMVALATMATFICAVVSWHAVEKPALARLRRSKPHSPLVKVDVAS